MKTLILPRLRATHSAPLLVVSLLLVAVGCGGTTTVPTRSVDASNPEVLYPLQEGNVWSHNVDVGERLPVLAITEVINRMGTRVEVSTSGSPAVVYEIRPGGIWIPSNEVWLLRSPVETGEEWPSLRGRTSRVVSTGASVEVPAGTFTDCARVEESGGDSGLTIATVYCPEVGPVQTEVSQVLELRDTPVEASSVMLGFALSE